MTRWQQVARAGAGEDYAEQYADRFRRMAARGGDVHGEADFVAGLRARPARVLDAGCGTGRVAIRLHELGYDVVGVDVDAIDAARWPGATRRTWTGTRPTWRRSTSAAAFDLVVVAGNTIPLLEPGTLSAAAARLAAHLDVERPAGLRLRPRRRPPARRLSGHAARDVDDAFDAAGLEPVERWSSWDRDRRSPTPTVTS